MKKLYWLIFIYTGLVGLFALIVAKNLMLLNFCLLAYVLGLRHALDADHVAAIDNLTRKWVQDQQDPSAIGFLFSLGHSTVVFMLCCLVALVTPLIMEQWGIYQKIGEVIGGGVSIFFLTLLAGFNLYLLYQTFLKFHQLKRGEGQQEKQVPVHPLVNILLKVTRKKWQIYLIGFLFGLGFDTATEIALLSITATQAAQGMPLVATLVLPALFMAGMCLVDTTVGMVSTSICRSVVTPPHQQRFNIGFTAAIALFGLWIAGIQGLGMLMSHFQWSSAFWQGIETLNGHFEWIGGIAAMMLFVTWVWVNRKYIGRSDA